MGRMGRRLGFVMTAVVVSVGLMVVSVPAASAKTVATDKWAKGFCQAVEGWQAKVNKAHSLVDAVVQQGVTSSSLAKSSQKQIVSALDAASKESSSAANAVKALGAPDIADGAKISSTISTSVAKTAKVFSDAKAAVAKAPTDPKQFQSKLKSISAKVDRDYATAGRDIDGIDALAKGGVLDKALSAEPACSFVNGS
jgi:hypothetical protein